MSLRKEPKQKHFYILKILCQINILLTKLPQIEKFG